MRANTTLVEYGTIYTLGYSQRKAAAILERLLRQPGLLLLDVRYQPVCRWNPVWNRAELAASYGEQYRWERRLGNVNSWSHSRPVQLPTGWQEAVHDAALLCAGTSLVLLCACSDERICHRRLIARVIQEAKPSPHAAQEVLA